MAALSLFPNYLLREWDAQGKPLSGGTLEFFQSGTFTPKAVFADSAGTVSLGNKVTLDASGSAVIFMSRGAYRVWLKNSVGAQVVPYIDGIVASGVGIDTQSTLTFAMVENYDALRQLTGEIDVVYVAGRSVEGDGGAGLFQYVPSDISTDNDGTILVTTVSPRVFKRVFDGFLDPLWFGVTYGIGESYYSLVSAMSASAALNFPLLIAGSVYISQNLTVPNGASIEFTDGAFLISGGSAVNVTFATGSHLRAVSRIFGTNIIPLIGKGVCDKLPISWMAGQVDDDRLDKLLLASTDPNQIVEIDESISVLATTWVCVNQLRFTFGSIITFTGTGDLNWTSKNILPIPFKTFAIAETDTYSFDFGSHYIYTEMFGALGDGVANDSIAFGFATFATNVELLTGKTYRLGTNPIKNSVFNIKGGILDLGSSTDLNASTLTLNDVGVVKSEYVNVWFTGTNLFAVNSSFPSNYSVSSVKSISNCSYNDDTRYPVLDGTVGPAVYNAHLPLIPGSAILGTDVNGKIKNNAESNYKFNGAIWDAISGFGAYGRKMSRIRYVQGRYWILGTDGYLGVSDDAITWTRVSIPNTTDILQDLIWNGTYYVLSSCLQGDGTDNYSIWRSLDGVNWTGGKIYNPAWTDESGTFQLSFVNNQVRNIAYNGSTIVVGAAYGYILVSTDHGATFTPVKMQISSNAYTGASWIGYITGQWVFCDGNGNWYYNDELVYNSFTKVGSGTAINKVLLMHWNGSTYKVIYSFGEVGTYTDLDRGGASDDWTIIPQGPHSFNDAYTANGLYVMAGAAGIATYYEGVDAWTPRNVPGVDLIQDSVGTPGVGCGGSPNGELFIISDRYVFRTT